MWQRCDKVISTPLPPPTTLTGCSLEGGEGSLTSSPPPQVSIHSEATMRQAHDN